MPFISRSWATEPWGTNPSPKFTRASFTGLPCKASSEAMVRPTLPVSLHSSATSSRPVFSLHCKMGPRSRGRMLLSLTTVAE